MAKFCGYCGTQLEDTAKICGNCGMPVEGTSTDVPSIKISDPEKQKKMKKTVKSVFILAVLVVVAVVTFNVVSQYTGYNGLLRKVMAAYEKYDIDTLISLSSDMYFYGEDDWVEYYFEDSVGDDLDYFEASVGHRYKLSYEVNETYTLSERKLSELLSEISYTYSDFDVDTIEKIVVSNITVTVKQGSKLEQKDLNVTMSKENDAWKLLYID